jgi:predicted deacylase
MSLDSFADSYAEARGKFLSAACDAGARIHTYGRDDLKGGEGEYLACEVAILGAENASRAALAITGTHGIEGFTGSAVLHRWLTSPHRAQSEDTKIVLVHAINPWAFSHKTRTTENNVDLNRNFIRDNVGYERENPAYDALAPFLHIDPSDARRSLAAYRAYKSYLDEHGWHLENQMLEGQYRHPTGLFFAGKEPEWSNRLSAVSSTSISRGP